MQQRFDMLVEQAPKQPHLALPGKRLRTS